MAKARGKPRIYRRRRGLRLLYLLMSFVLIVVAVVTGTVFFFQVDRIEIVGNTRYSEELLLAVAEIPPKANLFLLPRKAIQKRIEENLPYVKSAQLNNDYPSTLVLDVKESLPLASFQTPEGCWIMDARGKLLELVQDTLATDLIQIEGLTLLVPEVNTMADVMPGEESKFAALCALLRAIEYHGVAAAVAWIDMSQNSDIQMGYLGRFDVKLPLRTENSAIEAGSETYTLKIEALVKIVTSLNETDQGVIDLWEDRGFFRPS